MRKPRSDRKVAPMPISPRAVRMGEHAMRPVGRQRPDYLGVMDRLLTPEEVAEAMTARGYAVSAWSVRAWIRKGITVKGFKSRIMLAVVALPRGSRVRESALETFLQAIEAARDLVKAAAGGHVCRGMLTADLVVKNVKPAMDELKRERVNFGLRELGEERVRVGPAVRGRRGELIKA